MDWRLKVSCPAFLQKSGRGPGAEPLAARRSARNAPFAKEAQEGVKGGTLAGGSPFAGGPRRPQPVRRRGVTFSAQTRDTLKPCRGRRPRRPAAGVSANPATFRQPPVGAGFQELAYTLLICFSLCCLSTPFLWSCPKKRGGAPKKSAWGGGAPVRFRAPPASPTRVGGATRPLRCPLRGRIGSLAPGARGLGRM